MTKTLTMLVATIFAISVTGMAYAEESTVQVPFDYHGQTCWLESATLYQCSWEGVINPLTVEELELFQDVLTEEQYEAELEKLTVEPVVVEFVDERTPEEKLIDELQLKLYRGEADATEATPFDRKSERARC